MDVDVRFEFPSMSLRIVDLALMRAVVGEMYNPFRMNSTT